MSIYARELYLNYKNKIQTWTYADRRAKTPSYWYNPRKCAMEMNEKYEHILQRTTALATIMDHTLCYHTCLKQCIRSDIDLDVCRGPFSNAHKHVAVAHDRCVIFRHAIDEQLLSLAALGVLSNELPLALRHDVIEGLMALTDIKNRLKVYDTHLMKFKTKLYAAIATEDVEEDHVCADHNLDACAKGDSGAKDKSDAGQAAEKDLTIEDVCYGNEDNAAYALEISSSSSSDDEHEPAIVFVKF